MTIRFRIDESKLKNNAAVVAWYQRFGAECLKQMQVVAAERITSRTGNYNRNFEIMLLPGSPPKLVVGNSSRYAEWLESGTVPHRVAPVRKKALRWFDPPVVNPTNDTPGAIFSKGHVVSGIPAQNIVRDGVLRAGEELKRSSRADRILGR